MSRANQRRLLALDRNIFSSYDADVCCQYEHGVLDWFCYCSALTLLSIGDRTAWILPFTSGGFIYIALVTVVPDLLQDSRCPW